MNPAVRELGELGGFSNLGNLGEPSGREQYGREQYGREYWHEVNWEMESQAWIYSWPYAPSGLREGQGVQVTEK